MPYASVKDTPDYVQKLGANKARQWMHIMNQCLADGKPEATCFRMANGVVKKSISDEGAPVDEQWDDQPTETDDLMLYLAEKAFALPSDPQPKPEAWADSETPVLDTFASSSARLEQAGPSPLSPKGAGLLTGVLQALGFRSQPQAPSLPASFGEGLLVAKQADGRLRWFARYSNAWQDRDREIITEAAHKEYIEWVYAQKQEGVNVFPELWLWHTPGTRLGVADWLDFSDGFSHASGVIDDTPAAKDTVAKMAGQRLGVSHGMVCKQVGKYITGYRSFEISVLPLERASVWTTDFNVVGKETEAMAFTAERRKWLVGVLGEPAVVQLEGNTAAVATQLKQLGVEYKSVAEPPEGGDERNDLTGVAATTLAQQIADLTNAVQSMAGVVGQLQKDVADVKTPVDDKIADAFLAKISKAVGTRPTESAENVVDAKRVKAAGEPQNGDFLAQMLTKQFGINVGSAGAGPASVTTGTEGNGAAGTPAAAQVQIR